MPPHAKSILGNIHCTAGATKFKIFHIQSSINKNDTTNRYIGSRSIEHSEKRDDPTWDAPPRAGHLPGQQDPHATRATRFGFHSVHATSAYPTRGAPEPDPRLAPSVLYSSFFFFLKRAEYWQGPVKKKKKKPFILFYFSFVCLLILFAIFKKKIRISNFKIRNFKKKKKKKKRKLALTSKKKKNHLWDIF
jgi:hypothetical protein